MEEILIGLFINLIAKFIKNPQHAKQFQDQLDHISNGIAAVNTANNVTPTAAK